MVFDIAAAKVLVNLVARNDRENETIRNCQKDTLTDDITSVNGIRGVAGLQ